MACCNLCEPVKAQSSQTPWLTKIRVTMRINSPTLAVRGIRLY
jgi:hypothetical protein